ncbi:hypothetical protein BD560DRAFT_446166 [Blakeslea trispora]|nr:hypothetical protein BD560DRAFT_446166 [Blakeslea trispora]
MEYHTTTVNSLRHENHLLNPSYSKSSSLADSKISIDSDIQEMHPPFKLRVINPDFYEEDIDRASLSEIQYKPALNTASLEPNHPVLKEHSTVVPPPVTLSDSWQNDKSRESIHSSLSVPFTATSSQSVVTDQNDSYLPSVTRKFSKTLVEQKNDTKPTLELLPPLDFLPPLFSLDESHLVSNENIPTHTDQLTHVINKPTPPQLPQHHPDFLSTATGKSSYSIAQHSANATGLSSDPISTSEKEDSLKLEASLKNLQTLSSRQEPASRPAISHSRNPSLTPSLTPSSIYPTHIHQQQHQAATSRYSKASYSLTNHPDAIKLYRNMAVKTNDPVVQLTYAKYLLEVASMYDENRRPFRPNLTLSLPSFKRSAQRRDSEASSRPGSLSSRRSSIDTHVTTNTINTLSNMRRDSFVSQAQPFDENEEVNKRKKRKMLEEEGVRWIKKLAKQHVGEAAYLMALWHERGMYGLRKSPTKALKFYEIAANEKVPEAMFAVGQYHEKEQDYMTSFQLYEDAASLGLVEAYYRIGMINLNGEFGSRKNIPAAVQLFVRAAEKSTGSCPEAPYTLGLLLTDDYPNVTMPSELLQTYGGTFAAVAYFEHAADMGMAAAQFRLGFIYENGLYGTRVNLAKAHSYYEIAANSNNNGLAMLGLSRLYNHGVQAPPEQSEQQAIIFEADESGWIKSHPRDEDAAFKWCYLAADQRIPEACYLLGWYYEMGIGVPRDYQQAHQYYSKASKKGNHQEAKKRIELLENLVKLQKTEKKRLASQDKKPSVSNSRNKKDAQCNIM